MINIASTKYTKFEEITTHIFIPLCQTINRKLKKLQSNIENTKEFIAELKTIK